MNEANHHLERRQLVVAGLTLFILPCLFFWRVWWPNPNQQRVFAYGDFVEQHYPMRVFVSDELGQGRLPLWSPYTLGGEPAVAESLFAIYYPLGLWQALWPGRLPFLGLEMEAILHLGLAGLFTCLFIRRLTGRLDAGVLAGAAFSLSGFLTSYPMLQLIILETAIWLPAGLWLIERAFQRHSLWNMALAGVVLGFGILAGHFQTFLYVVYAVAAYFLFRAIQLKPGWRFIILAAGILALITVGVGAAQWLPSLQMAPFSPHAEPSYEYVSPGFQLHELWGLLRPNAGQWSPLYVGVLALILAVLAPLSRRWAENAFWMATVFLALLLSLGRNGFLYPLAYQFAPGFALFRQQERAAFIVVFGLCVLAGYGYAALARQRWWPRRAALPIAITLVFVNLYLAHQGVNLQKPPAGGYFAETPASRTLETFRDAIWRISSESLLPGDGNAGLIYRLRDVTGSGPLYLLDFERFLEKVPEMRWWQMLKVDFVLTRRHLDHGALLPVLDAGDQRVYQVFLNGRPAWIVHDFQVVAGGPAEAIARTAQADFDPFQTVVLEETPAIPPAPANGPETAQIVAFAPQRVIVEAELSAPGIVVLSEVTYPGWVAWANGQRVTTLRAYGVLRAVALPAGEWEIEWRFIPHIAYLGLALTLACLAIVVVWWILRRRHQFYC